jgi:hypothetical protein
LESEGALVDETIHLSECGVVLSGFVVVSEQERLNIKVL